MELVTNWLQIAIAMKYCIYNRDARWQTIYKQKLLEKRYFVLNLLMNWQQLRYGMQPDFNGR
jgi:hypothetical protein